MAYIDQRQDPRRRAAAIAGVAAIHGALGAALLLGLSIAGVGPEIDEWDPFTITPQPTPTPPPPAADPSPPAQEPRITAPVPPIDLRQLEPRDDAVVSEPANDNFPLVAAPTPIERPTPTPRPAPTFTPRAAAPSNEQARWITTDDYPARALRDGVEGTVGYRLVIGSNGRVSACEVTKSSGNVQLDEASCRLIERRARFSAATDESGAEIVGTYSGTVRWQIPD